jgi:hypothetical protein
MKIFILISCKGANIFITSQPMNEAPRKKLSDNHARNAAAAFRVPPGAITMRLADRRLPTDRQGSWFRISSAKYCHAPKHILGAA